MGFNVIAPVGDNLKALFVGMKEFPTQKVFLITPIEQRKKAEKLKQQLEEFTIPSEIIDVEGNLLEAMFRIFGQLCASNDHDELIVNVATGDRLSTCAALSAAYANGLKAFGVMNDQTMILPIMKLSYYSELSDNKMNILKELERETYLPLQELSKKLDMSLSLLSYHINGNHRYKGLKSFRLIDVKETNKQLHVRLSEMGNLLLKGYIKPADTPMVPVDSCIT